MAIADKVAAARKIEDLLKKMIQYGDLRIRYRITIDPPIADDRQWERPEILIELSGADSSLVLARNAELLRAIEHLALEMLDLGRDEHDKVIFDCMNHRFMRMEELRLAANVAATRVRESGRPYEFGPMSSRERRILHLALRDIPELRTESGGMGPERHVVLYPKDYQAKPAAPPRFSRGRRR